MARHLAAVLVASLSFGASLTARAFPQVPLAVTGPWAGVANVSSQWTELTPIDVFLVIAPEGRVNGTIGGAVLRNARLERGRRLFGRIFRHGPEWRIAGDVDGCVIPSEALPVARVIISLDWARDHFDGQLIVAGPPMARGRRELLVAERFRLDRAR